MRLLSCVAELRDNLNRLPVLIRLAAFLVGSIELTFQPSQQGQRFIDPSNPPNVARWRQAPHLDKLTDLAADGNYSRYQPITRTQKPCALLIQSTAPWIDNYFGNVAKSAFTSSAASL